MTRQPCPERGPEVPALWRGQGAEYKEYNMKYLFPFWEAPPSKPRPQSPHRDSTSPRDSLPVGGRKGDIPL